MHESVYIIPQLCDHRIDEKITPELLRSRHSEKSCHRLTPTMCIYHEDGSKPFLQKLEFLFLFRLLQLIGLCKSNIE